MYSSKLVENLSAQMFYLLWENSINLKKIKSIEVKELRSKINIDNKMESISWITNYTNVIRAISAQLAVKGARNTSS